MPLRHATLRLVLSMTIISWPLVQAADAEPEKPNASAVETGTGGKSDVSKPLEGTVEKASVTHHEILVDGQKIKYRATAANMPMKDENGKLKATVFFVAYEKETPSDQSAAPQPGAAATTKAAGTGGTATEPASAASTQPACKDPEHRPITFLFNGGPGSAAVWLHLGAAGPRRVALQEDGRLLPPPYHLEDNPSTWLDATDLVFIDPVGTGFSRPAEGEKGEQFYGVKEDITWVADFIRLYTTKYERWLSPKFLAGESYGTTRAVGLSDYLIRNPGIALNGIVLISSVLDFQTLDTDGGNDLAYWLYLPSYTAIAWYHKKLAPDLQQDLEQTLKEVEQWAATSYTVTLAKGLGLSSDERQSAVKLLTRYTGLPAEYVERANLRISPWGFQKELLRGERKILGHLDGRITGYNQNPASDWPDFDVSLEQYLTAYSSTFNDYVRRTLKYDSLLPYNLISRQVRPWKNDVRSEWGHYLSVMDDLQYAMIKNPDMRVLFASGYHDLATPYFATNYTIDRLDVGPIARPHITHTFYEGGHMMYHNRPSLAKLKNDVAAFIEAAVPPRQERK